MITDLNDLITGVKLSDGTTININSFFRLQNEFYQRNNLANITQVNDLTESTEIAQLLKSIDIAFLQLFISNDNQLKNCFIDTATGSYLDMLCSEYNLSRESGISSIGSIWVFRSVKPEAPVFIPAGTKFRVSNKIKYFDDGTGDMSNYYDDTKGLTFYSMVDATIALNPIVNRYGFSYGVEIPIKSVGIGSVYNVDPYSIDTIDEEFSSGYDDLSCINVDKTLGGLDDESDLLLRRRLLLSKSVNSIGTFNYYKDLILSSDKNIMDVNLFISNESLDHHFIFTVYLKLYYPELLYDYNGSPVELLQEDEKSDILVKVGDLLKDKNNVLINHKFPTCEKDSDKHCKGGNIKFADSNRFFMSVGFSGTDMSLIHKSFILDLNKNLSSYFRGVKQSFITNDLYTNYTGFNINDELFDKSYIGPNPGERFSVNTNNLYNFLESYSYIDEVHSIQFINQELSELKPDLKPDSNQVHKLTPYPLNPTNNGIETRWTDYTYARNDTDNIPGSANNSSKIPLSLHYKDIDEPKDTNFSIDLPYIYSEYDKSPPALSDFNKVCLFMYNV